MNAVFVLILVLANSVSSQAGAAAVEAEFSTKEKCLAAGQELVNQAKERDRSVLVFGCFPK